MHKKYKWLLLKNNIHIFMSILLKKIKDFLFQKKYFFFYSKIVFFEILNILYFYLNNFLLYHKIPFYNHKMEDFIFLYYTKYNYSYFLDNFHTGSSILYFFFFIKKNKFKNFYFFKFFKLL
jgi:hypothetical protein